MMDREGLADHAADREADEVHFGDLEGIEGGADVVGERLHGVVAVDGIAAAVAAHIKAQDTVAGSEKLGDLFRPHAAVG